MKFKNKLLTYVAPQVEILEVEVEKGFELSGGIENPSVGENYDW
jgi:hypothetical protein